MEAPAARSGRGSPRATVIAHAKTALPLPRRWPAPLLAVLVGLAIGGCQSYTESTPRTVHEGDNEANYSRVFREPRPDDVTVVNSVVVAYGWRPGVVTTDDFEFELLVPAAWIDKWTRRFRLHRASDFRIADRKDRAMRPWYVPNPIDRYDTYIDATSVGYVHMLVDPEAVEGRFRVYVSKH